MVDNTLFSNGHVTMLSFLRLESEQLSDESRECILLHLSNCEYCMERYVDSLTDDSLMPVPELLETNIISYINQNDGKKQQKKILVMQFVKLAIAVSLMMVMLFGGVFEKIGSVSGDIMYSMSSIEQQAVVPKPQKPATNEQVETSRKSFFDITIQFGDNFNAFAYKFNNNRR